jgi:hypothetical protein
MRRKAKTWIGEFDGSLSRQLYKEKLSCAVTGQVSLGDGVLSVSVGSACLLVALRRTPFRRGAQTPRPPNWNSLAVRTLSDLVIKIFIYLPTYISVVSLNATGLL